MHWCIQHFSGFTHSWNEKLWSFFILHNFVKLQVEERGIFTIYLVLKMLKSMNCNQVKFILYQLMDIHWNQLPSLLNNSTQFPHPFPIQLTLDNFHKVHQLAVSWARNVKSLSDNGTECKFTSNAAQKNNANRNFMLIFPAFIGL